MTTAPGSRGHYTDADRHSLDSTRTRHFLDAIRTRWKPFSYFRGNLSQRLGLANDLFERRLIEAKVNPLVPPETR
jgi:hypothetical protein